MDENNKPIEVTLNIPKEDRQKKPWSLTEIVRILVRGWKILAVCFAVFVVIGGVSSYLFIKSQSKPVSGGMWSLEYELSFPGIESGTGLDGRPYNRDEIKKLSYIEEAISQSGLDVMGITAADIISRLTVTDVPPPDATRQIVLYEEMAKTNISYKEKILGVIYYPDRFTITLRGDGPLVAAGDSLAKFMEELISAYQQGLKVLQDSETASGAELSSIAELSASAANIVEEEDYPIALFELMLLLKSVKSELYTQIGQASTGQIVTELKLTGRAEVIAGTLTGLQEKDIPALRREIETNRLTRDRDALLARLSTDKAAAEAQYVAAAEEARLLTELMAGAYQSDVVRMSHLVRLAREAAQSAAEAFNRQSYYGHLLENYASPEVNLSEASNAETMFNSIIQKIQEVQEIQAFVTVPVSFSLFPQPSASISRVALIFIGMAFMGLFAGLLIVFGKRLYIGKITQA